MSFPHFMFFLHLLGVTIWLGGIAFLYLCLYPATKHLPPSQRLPLWADVLRRFFPLAWAAIAIILFSGFNSLYNATNTPVAWHIMMVTGLIMIAVHGAQWQGSWRRLHHAVKHENWADGSIALHRVWQFFGFNLGLGITTVVIATMGLTL